LEFYSDVSLLGHGQPPCGIAGDQKVRRLFLVEFYSDASLLGHRQPPCGIAGDQKVRRLFLLEFYSDASLLGQPTATLRNRRRSEGQEAKLIGAVVGALLLGPSTAPIP
jgi:hypothetical protein